MAIENEQGMSASRYCSACGSRVDASRFCGACGASQTVSPGAGLGAQQGRWAGRDWSRVGPTHVLALVGLGLAACALLLVVSGVRDERLSGETLEGMLREQLLAMGTPAGQANSLRCAHSESYGDGDVAECIVDDPNGDSATLIVRIFEEDSGWRMQLDVDR